MFVSCLYIDVSGMTQIHEWGIRSMRCMRRLRLLWFFPLNSLYGPTQLSTAAEAKWQKIQERRAESGGHCKMRTHSIRCSPSVCNLPARTAVSKISREPEADPLFHLLNMEEWDRGEKMICFNFASYRIPLTPCIYKCLHSMKYLFDFNCVFAHVCFFSLHILQNKTYSKFLKYAYIVSALYSNSSIMPINKHFVIFLLPFSKPN